MQTGANSIIEACIFYQRNSYTCCSYLQ